VESIGAGVGRPGIDLAHDDVAARGRRLRDQIGVEAAGMTASPRGGRDRNPVHVDEAGITLAEPQVVRAVIVGVLIEGEQEGHMTDPARVEGSVEQDGETLRIEPRQLRGIGVVEGEECCMIVRSDRLPAVARRRCVGFTREMRFVCNLHGQRFFQLSERSMIVSIVLQQGKMSDMGLLDSVIGGLMGGGAGGASPIAGVLMNMLGGGGQAGGTGQGFGGQGTGGQGTGGQGGMGNGMAGGLGGLVSSFEQAGLGHIAQSWIGNGPNQSVSPQQLQNVFGQGQVQNMASQAGMQPNDFLSQLSQHLPNAVHGMTPDGQMPDQGTVSV